MSTYSPIASQTLSTSAPSVTFSGVPQGYTDLIIIIKGQGTSNIAITTTFNDDTATNYSRAYFYADGSGQASGRIQNESGVNFSFNAARGHTIMHINGYSNPFGFKNALISNDYYDNGVVRTSGVWRNTAPITSIKFSASDLASGTVISLYGLAGGQAGVKASGGVITTSGAYTIHTFTQTGGFIPNEDLTVDYLVVAGGGGGGGFGGGGAGGLRSTVTQTGGNSVGVNLETSLSLTAGVTYPAIVGAGGAGTTNPTSGGSAGAGTNGSNSVFSTITSTGGGGGAQGTASNGGSGGGTLTGTKGTGTANQGYAGGDGYNNGSGDASGGGGGGAGAVGQTVTSGTAGAGGIGVATSISGSSTYYAGGGAGGGDARSPGTNGGSGGSGGGGNGSGANGNIATAGTANTGGGGGGSGYSGSPNFYTPSKAGGSGIVIVRYLT